MPEFPLDHEEGARHGFETPTPFTVATTASSIRTHTLAHDDPVVVRIDDSGTGTVVADRTDRKHSEYIADRTHRQHYSATKQPDR